MDRLFLICVYSLTVLVCNGFPYDDFHDKDDKNNTYQYIYVRHGLNIFFYIIPAVFVTVFVTILIIYCCVKVRDSQRRNPQCLRCGKMSRFGRSDFIAPQYSANFCSGCQIMYPNVQLTYGTVDPSVAPSAGSTDSKIVYSNDSGCKK